MYAIEQLNLNLKKNHFKSLTHKKYEEYIQINYTINNPNFFDADKIFNNYITNHNKKFELYLVTADFNLYFHNDLNAQIKTEFHYNLSLINLKQNLLNWVDFFILKVYKFSHITEMNIKTISDKISYQKPHEHG